MRNPRIQRRSARVFSSNKRKITAAVAGISAVALALSAWQQHI